MGKEFEILGASRVVQYKGNAKVEISEELNEDLLMHITFLAMNVEVLARKLGVSIDKIQGLIKQNIEVEPMDFSLEQEEE
jgi:hypothetical protein